MAPADLKLASPAGTFKSAGMETGLVGFCGEGLVVCFFCFCFFGSCWFGVFILFGVFLVLVFGLV